MYSQGDFFEISLENGGKMSTASSLVSNQLPPITTSLSAAHNAQHGAAPAKRNEKTADQKTAQLSPQVLEIIEKLQSEIAYYKKEAEKWEKEALDAQRTLSRALIAGGQLQTQITRLQAKLAAVDGFESFVVADLERRKELARTDTKA